MIDSVFKEEVGIVAAAGERLSQIGFEITSRDIVFFEEDGFAIYRFH